MPSTPHSNDPRDQPGEFVVGKDGKPVVDRYGRPIRKRSASPAPQRHSADEPVRKVLREREAIQPERRRPAQQPLPAQQPRATRQLRPEQSPAAQERPAQQRPVQQRPVQQRPDQPARPRQKMPNETAYQPRSTPVHPSQTVQQRPRRPDQPPRPQQLRPRSQGPKIRVGSVLSALVTVVLVAGIVVTLLADARLTRVDAFPDAPVANTAGTNWLIVGSDSRQGLSEEEVQRLGTGGDIGDGRTDTIMLLHIPTTGKPTLLSIPRDSYVEIPGYGADKINAAFVYGGPKLLTQTVENATKLRIDHYAEIGMGGLAGITDAVGGVELCPPEPMQDPLANLDVQAGCQVMDGPTALGYVRTRATAMGDLDRVQRQREFLSALMHQVVSPGVLLNPFRSIPLALRASGMFIVGTGDHVWHLARLALAMAGGVTTETVPVADFRDTEVGNVLIWDDAAAEQLFSSLR